MDDDVDQALIISALRQAARRDEHEMALAAPLRKAGDEAIALLRKRARKPAPPLRSRPRPSPRRLQWGRTGSAGAVVDLRPRSLPAAAR